MSYISKLTEELNKILESQIDFPKEGLATEVWEKTSNGYRLQSEVRQVILEMLTKYPEIDLLSVAKEVHIVGSIGTNLNVEGADVDIHIIPDLEQLKDFDLDWLQKDVMDWYKNHRDEEGWKTDNYVFEVYLQYDENQDFYSDAVYDVLEDKWIKTYKEYDMSYNPYKVYANVFDKIQELTKPADEVIGELRRDVIDYNRLKKFFIDAPIQVKEEIKEYLEGKIKEIENDIEDLVENKEIWREVRHNNSIATEDVITDINKLTQSPEWLKGNAIFKFLDRYQYMVLVNNLKKLIDDKELSDEDIPKIHDILKQFNDIEDIK